MLTIVVSLCATVQLPSGRGDSISRAMRLVVRWPAAYLGRARCVSDLMAWRRPVLKLTAAADCCRLLPQRAAVGSEARFLFLTEADDLD